MMEQIFNYYPFIALGCIVALILLKFRLSKYLKYSEQFSSVFYPPEVVAIRRQTLNRRQHFLTGIIGLFLVSVIILRFNDITENRASTSQTIETPLAEKVSFKYKRKIYRVDVNVVTDNNTSVYKLYFRNKIENTGNNTLELLRKQSKDGLVKWECKSDDPSNNQYNEIASIAGAAIDKVLREKIKHVKIMSES